MENRKLKTYNQVILAILATLSVVCIIVLFGTFIYYEYCDRNYYRYDNELISDDVVDKLAKDSLRQQIISFNSAVLVDSVNLKYIIPLSNKTLKNVESVNQDVLLGLMDSGFKPYRDYDRYYNGFLVHGLYVNLLLYDAKLNKSKPIVTNRILIDDFSVRYFEDDILIIFAGIEKDTDNDGKITSKDFTSLFIYSLKEGSLRRIFMEYSTMLSYDLIEGEKDLLINFGLDRNKDNIYDNRREPSYVMKYDYKKDTLLPIIESNLEIELQKILDKMN